MDDSVRSYRCTIILSMLYLRKKAVKSESRRVPVRMENKTTYRNDVDSTSNVASMSIFGPLLCRQRHIKRQKQSHHQCRIDTVSISPLRSGVAQRDGSAWLRLAPPGRPAARRCILWRALRCRSDVSPAGAAWRGVCRLSRARAPLMHAHAS